MLNHKGNAEDHIIQLKRKTEAAYQTILAVLGNQYFNKIELETAWKLIETCIQPILTYGGETMNTTKKEQRKINQIQENIIRRILMVPQSTPISSTIHGDRAARHNYHHHKKPIQHGKKTT